MCAVSNCEFLFFPLICLEWSPQKQLQSRASLFFSLMVSSSSMQQSSYCPKYCVPFSSFFPMQFYFACPGSIKGLCLLPMAIFPLEEEEEKSLICIPSTPVSLFFFLKKEEKSNKHGHQEKEKRSRRHSFFSSSSFLSERVSYTPDLITWALLLLPEKRGTWI